MVVEDCVVLTLALQTTTAQNKMAGVAAAAVTLFALVTAALFCVLCLHTCHIGHSTQQSLVVLIKSLKQRWTADVATAADVQPTLEQT